jgi:hypothetical protein
MWNHSRLMEGAAAGQTSWPVLSGRDFADLAAYLAREARR